MNPIICARCQQPFSPTETDLEFYRKLQVPPPTWCPECRTARRMTWRNERALYKRKSDLSGKEIIALYAPDKPFKVYDQSEWWSDAWDGVAYGREYDFSKPFFNQIRELQEVVPRISIFNLDCINSPYSNQSYWNKNLYLCFSVVKSEDSSYCTNFTEVKNSLDLLYVNKSELLYECIDTDQSYRSRFLVNSENCTDCAFLFDCRNCQDCIGGVGLRNKKYVFWGKELSAEEYRKRKAEFDLGSFSTLAEARKRFSEMIRAFPRRAARFRNCTNSSGDFLRNCKNTHQTFWSFDLEDCGYNTRIYGCKDVYDNYGIGKSALTYETIGSEEVYNVKFSNVVDPSRNLTYCDLCFNCEDCFGCVGLRGKQYCILNKQYTKEEYESLVPEIIEHMNGMPYTDKKGRVYRYGEFFPPELSPFSYNETIAQEYFPLTRREAVAEGYRWQKEVERNYHISVPADKLPDHIRDVPDSVLQEVIGCQHGGTCHEQCTTAFRLIPMELDFYREMSIPLPRLCPNCRHYQRLAQRNPLKLWHRNCQCAGEKSENSTFQNTGRHVHGPDHCPNEFETSYPPERPEIVYCEACYQQEVI